VGCSQTIPRKGPGGVAHVYIFTKPVPASREVATHDEALGEKGSDKPHSPSGGGGGTFGGRVVGGGAHMWADTRAVAEDDEAKLLAVELNAT